MNLAAGGRSSEVEAAHRGERGFEVVVAVLGVVSLLVLVLGAAGPDLELCAVESLDADAADDIQAHRPSIQRGIAIM